MTTSSIHCARQYSEIVRLPEWFAAIRYLAEGHAAFGASR
jgi:hypothetical protein